MYTPSAFVVDDLPTLHAFIRQYSFATVVSTGSDRPEASHLPLLLDSESGDFGQLIGHMAKANDQWNSAADQEVLAIFHGPHAYITPSWYSEVNAVPTWNYAAVHVYGVLKIETDPDNLKQIVEQYVDTYESPMVAPWDLDSADGDFVEKLMAAIVGFRIDIERIEGKWKLSQNHSEERRQRVIKGLQARQQSGDAEVAELMIRTASD